MKAMEAINKRIAVHSYSDETAEKPTRKELENIWRANRAGFFGSEVRFKVPDLGELTRLELRSRAGVSPTYGTGR